MPLPSRQKCFLTGTAALGLLILLSGLWEFYVAGAVHELACGSVILLLTAIAWRTWPRAAAAEPTEIRG